MRKQFLYLFLSLVFAQTIVAQTRGTKVGFIDMEYILQNVPDYTEAKLQLDQKVEKWKLEIETKKIEINKLKEALKAERALLTKELIDERETEINFLETENLEYQQKRFGPNGDLIIQKSLLVKPIQDQVFTAVQDIAERLKYDFIFDKTSDLTMLFAAKRFDLSDQIVRTLTRTEKREQLTKKQQKAEEDREKKEDALDENPALADRQKVLDDKKSARDKVIADRKLLIEQKKKDFEDKRAQTIADREAKKNGTVSANMKTEATPAATDAPKAVVDDAKQKQDAAKAQTIEDRKKILEDRKKALEEKRKKILEEREAIRKAKEEKLKENTNKN